MDETAPGLFAVVQVRQITYGWSANCIDLPLLLLMFASALWMGSTVIGYLNNTNSAVQENIGGAKRSRLTI